MIVLDCYQLFKMNFSGKCDVHMSKCFFKVISVAVNHTAYLNHWDLHLKDIMFFAVRKYESVKSLNCEAVSFVGHVLAYYCIFYAVLDFGYSKKLCYYFSLLIILKP